MAEQAEDEVTKTSKSHKRNFMFRVLFLYKTNALLLLLSVHKRAIV